MEKTNLTSRPLTWVLSVLALVFAGFSAQAQSCPPINVGSDACAVATALGSSIGDVIIDINGDGVFDDHVAGVALVIPTDITYGSYEYQGATGCWNTILIEDTNAPVLTAGTAQANTVIACELPADPADVFVNAAGGVAPTADDCGVAITPTVTTVVTEDDFCVAGVLTVDITWTFSDGSDKSDDVSETLTLTITRPDVVASATTSDELDCDETAADAECGLFLDMDGSGDVSVGDTRLSAGVTCGYFVTADASDPEDICPIGNDATYKQVTTYTAYDWCAPADPPTAITCLLKIEDNDAPTFDACPTGTPEFNVEADGCYANVEMSAPATTDVCDAEVTVSWVITNADGDVVASGTGDVDENIALDGCSATFDINWSATDECGNNDPANDCSYSFTIVDNRVPVAIAETYHTVSVDEDCFAIVTAAAINDGSYDFCGDVTVDVARMGANGGPLGYGPSVTLTKADGECSDTETILFRVTDACGYESVVMVEVELQDKTDPTITADNPADMTCLDFDGPLSDLTDAQIDALFPAAVSDDNCTGETIAYSNRVVTEGDCGAGSTITRDAQATDVCGNTSDVVTQTLTINFVNDWTVTIPDGGDMECTQSIDEIVADLEDASFASLGGVNNGCSQIGVEVDAAVYEATDACYKIVARYSILDWCVWDGEAIEQVIFIAPEVEGVVTDEILTRHNGHGYVNRVIKVYDNEAPVVSVSTTDACDDDGDCTEGTSFDLTVSDNCSTDIIGTWTLTDAAGAVVATGTTDEDVTIETGELAIGSYTVTFSAIDGCGNTSDEATGTISITDCKAPAPICIAQIIVDVMEVEGGMVEVWALDFIASPVEDACSPSVKYYIDVDGDPTTTGDLEAGAVVGNVCDGNNVWSTSLQATGWIVGANSVLIAAVDDAGNIGYCQNAVLLINDSENNACNSGGAAINGAIENEAQEAVENVTVTLSGNMSEVAVTGAGGQFAFSGLEAGYDYTVTPEKDINPLNGVSTFDLVLMTKHILSVDELDSPYQHVAADINRSGEVSTYDVVLLRRLILAVDTDFTNNTSWRFVDADYSFDVNAEGEYLIDALPEVMNVNNISAEELAADFVAVKVGDVSGNAIPNNLVSTQGRTNGTLAFNATDAAVKAGETVTVDFTADMANVLGYQFTMNFSDALELVDIKEGVATAENFGTALVSEGVLTTSWNGTAKADDVLFSLVFNATAATQLSEALNVTSNVTKAEAYNSDAELMDVSLQFNGTATAAGFELLQNTPNPFSAETMISFTMPEATNGTLKVYDVNGKVLKLVSGTFDKGLNQVTVDAAELQAGVLYYTLETADYTATKKMIIVK